MANVLRGECECRATQYEVRDEFVYAANCHCSRCRAGTGTAFKAFAGIEREKLTVTDGADNLLVWGDDRGTTRAAARAARCSTRSCATASTCTSRWGRSRTSRPSARPSHIFVGSKAPWFEITDDLPQADEY